MAGASAAARSHGRRTASASPNRHRTCLSGCERRRISMGHVVRPPELGNFSSLIGGLPCYVSLTSGPAASNRDNKGHTMRPNARAFRVLGSIAGLLLVALAVGSPSVARAQQRHGGQITKDCRDPRGLKSPRPGEQVTCQISVTNADTFGDALRIDRIVDTIQRAAGPQVNTIPLPLNLPPSTVAVRAAPAGRGRHSSVPVAPGPASSAIAPAAPARRFCPDWASRSSSSTRTSPTPASWAPSPMTPPPTARTSASGTRPYFVRTRCPHLPASGSRSATG